MSIAGLGLKISIEIPSLKWFQSFVTDWSFSVHLGSSSSEISVPPCGVPQGTVLGLAPVSSVIFPSVTLTFCSKTGFTVVCAAQSEARMWLNWANWKEKRSVVFVVFSVDWSAKHSDLCPCCSAVLFTFGVLSLLKLSSLFFHLYSLCVVSFDGQISSVV